MGSWFWAMGPHKARHFGNMALTRKQILEHTHTHTKELEKNRIHQVIHQTEGPRVKHDPCV